MSDELKVLVTLVAIPLFALAFVLILRREDQARITARQHFAPAALLVSVGTAAALVRKGR